MQAGLYIVATPIGNPEDITLRALHCLKSADLILCEDTRVTGQLLKYHKIEARLESYHEHNAEEKRPKVMEWLKAGRSIALVSDAGTPLVSDPGFKLAKEARAAGFYVTSLPGACAAVTALTLSGLPSNRFFFYGFLPAKSGARKKALEEIADVSATVIFYESKVRLLDTLQDIESVWGNCQVSLVREITKEYEEAITSSVKEMEEKLANAPVKGEIVLLVDRHPSPHNREDLVDPLIHQYLAKYPVKKIAQLVAAATGVSKNKVYERALELKKRP